MAVLQLLADKNVFTPVKVKKLLPEQLQKAIRPSMFLKKKFNLEEESLKLKSRLVADGDQQDRVLCEDVSSPSASVTIYVQFSVLQCSSYDSHSDCAPNSTPTITIEFLVFT